MISLIGTVRKLRQVKRAKKFLYENFPFKNPLESQQIMINISLQITWRNPRTLPQKKWRSFDIRKSIEPVCDFYVFKFCFSNRKQGNHESSFVFQKTRVFRQIFTSHENGASHIKPIESIYVPNNDHSMAFG